MKPLKGLTMLSSSARRWSCLVISVVNAYRGTIYGLTADLKHRVRRLHRASNSTLSLRQPANRCLELVAAFTAAALLFLALRSSDYTSVDGGLRALNVYRAPQVHLHAMNHLLYPLNVRTWIGMLQRIGFATQNPEDILALAQSMNAVAAATVVALIFGALRALTLPFGTACLVSAAYALSRAVNIHATNAAEPPVGSMPRKYTSPPASRTLRITSLRRCSAEWGVFSISVARLRVSLASSAHATWSILTNVDRVHRARARRTYDSALLIATVAAPIWLQR
jgi:hypothetical protein